MFKASIQRQVRLRNVARQLSTVALPRRTSSKHLAVLHRTSQPALQHLVPRLVFSRLYTAQSAAVQANQEAESAVSSASVTQFAELSQLGVDKHLIAALTEGMGYDTMTEVQSMTINPALKGTDMVAQAKTGTGKTLAFLVPLFQRVLADRPELADRRIRRRASSEDIRAIILSPTRELAEQIGTEARKLAKNTGIVVQTAVGGTRKREALWKMHQEGCDVLVATPGRLNDLLSDPQARVGAPKLQAFVLDEADRMLDVGFADELRSIQEALPSPREVERQTLLFSATIPRDVVHLAKSMVRPDNFEFVQTIKEDDAPTHERVPQHLVTVNGFENIYPTILEIVDKARAAQGSGLPFKAIVFFSNTASVRYAYQIFRRTQTFSRFSGIQSFEIHSRLTQAMRTRSADSFRRAKSAVLFSSDVTARGMDFPNVTDVIQVGLPPDRDQYIHRVGRTGRAGHSGKGWLILTGEEISEARYRLPGLPIKPNNTIESAQHEFGVGSPSKDVSRFFSEIANVYSAVPKSEFRALYLACLGQKFSKTFDAADCIQLLNKWCQGAMGWPEVPAIPPRIATIRGLSRLPGVRIGHDEDDEPEIRGSDNRFGSNSNFKHNGFNRDNRSHNRDNRSHNRDNRSHNRDNRGHSRDNRGHSRDNRGHSRDNRNSFESRFESRFASRSDGRSRQTSRASF
ncbi:hypothetical protein NUW58_g3567 [Xylaria curta]|uniref:Uncharacterized protein n=1 Tax=Xylaria curta TaxID=42375 RepID=A0ACC1PCQ2_9PEZI|nr:hypothetical protein NUW58_g3567 [Xylaria curta]